MDFHSDYFHARAHFWDRKLADACAVYIKTTDFIILQLALERKKKLKQSQLLRARKCSEKKLANQNTRKCKQIKTNSKFNMASQEQPQGNLNILLANLAAMQQNMQNGDLSTIIANHHEQLGSFQNHLIPPSCSPEQVCLLLTGEIHFFAPSPRIFSEPTYSFYIYFVDVSNAEEIASKCVSCLRQPFIL